MSRRIKRFLSLFLVSALLLPVVPKVDISALALPPTSEEETEKSERGIKLNESSISLKRGEKFQLTAEVTVSGKSSEDVWWKSEDPLIASVDSNGLVTTFNKYGAIYITAYLGSEFERCLVCVVPEDGYYIKNYKDIPINTVFGKTATQYNVFPLKADSAKKGKVNISWKKQKQVKRYELQRAKVNGGKYKTIAKQKKVKYTDKKVKTGTKYKYRVCAVGTDGRRRYSSVTKVITAGKIAGNEKPDTPSHVQAFLYADDAISIEWAKTERADGYCVYRREEGGSWKYKLVKTLSGNKNTKWLDENRKPFHVYGYKVAAFWIRDGKRIYSKESYSVSVRTYEGDYVKIVNADGLEITLKKNQDTKKGEMNINSTVSAKAVIESECGDIKTVSENVTWSSSDESILNVDRKGVITSGTKEGYCTIYARTHNGITKSVKIKVVNYANPVHFPKYGSGMYRINNLLTAYRSEIQDIMTYFTIYGKKGESGTISLYDIYGTHEVRGIPSLKKISLVEKKIRKIITEFPMLIEISYDYNEITFKVTYSYYGYDKLTYSRVDRFDNNKYQMAPHWKYYHNYPPM